jgi:hypothetical protein
MLVDVSTVPHGLLINLVFTKRFPSVFIAGGTIRDPGEKNDWRHDEKE